MRWTKDALELLQKIPEHIRPMAKQVMELHARQAGVATIGHELMQDVRKSFETRYGGQGRCPFRDDTPSGTDAGTAG